MAANEKAYTGFDYANTDDVCKVSHAAMIAYEGNAAGISKKFYEEKYFGVMMELMSENPVAAKVYAEVCGG